MKEFITKLRANNIFISLEGENLKLRFDQPQLPQSLIDEIKKRKYEIIDYLKGNSIGVAVPESIVKIEEHSNGYVLSSSQERIWILSQFEESNIIYNIVELIKLEGDLNKQWFESSFMDLIERHEVLRTVFREDTTGKVKQFVLSADEYGFKIDYQDLTQTDNQSEYIRSIIQKDITTPFDLSLSPLIRAKLLKTGEQNFVFCLVIHHVISDSWSLNLMFEELFTLYVSRASNRKIALQPLRIQYKDYADWQQKELSADKLKRHEEYWLKQLQGDIPVLNISVDKDRPVVKTYSGKVISTEIDPHLHKGLKSITQANGASLFMGLLAVVNALMYKYTSNEDIVIGSSIAGRVHADLEFQQGAFLNILALRTQFKGSHSFRQLLSNVKNVTVGAYEHQVYPFDKLISLLHLKRDMSRSALFDVMLVLQNTAINNNGIHTTIPGLAVKKYHEEKDLVSKFDITFSVFESTEELLLKVEYNSDIFSPKQIDDLCNHFKKILTHVVEDQEISISEIKEKLDQFDHDVQKAHLQSVRMKNIMNLKNKK